MYKGNMQDFCHRLSSYLRENYNSKLLFGKYSEYYYVAFFGPDTDGAVAYRVFDSEDFEQQVYDYINEELKDVQEEYDGFPEQSDEVLGEEI